MLWKVGMKKKSYDPKKYISAKTAFAQYISDMFLFILSATGSIYLYL